MQNLVSRIAGVDNEELANRGIGMGATMGYTLKSIAYQFKGNNEEDFKESNLEYKENLSTYKYKIICKECGAIIYRQRLKKNLIKKYRCGKCNGRLEVAS